MPLGEPSQLAYVVADGAVVASGTPCVIYGVTLNPGTLGTASVDVKTGGSGGTVKVHLDNPLGSGVSAWHAGNVTGATIDGIYVDLTGTGATAVIEYATL